MSPAPTTNAGPSSSGIPPSSLPTSTVTENDTKPSSSSSSSKANDLLPRYLNNDPSRTGYDPSIQWWMNYFKILTGQITPEGIEHYREDRYKANEARDCARCEADRDWLFQNSPVVRFLREKVANLNGVLDETNVVCRRCPSRIVVIPGNKEKGEEDRIEVARQGGGFSPDHGILLCANEMRNRGHLEDTLAHEMVHAWDHLRWKVDWFGEKSLRHAACTEIRASMLSGECRWTRESIVRGNWTLTQQFQNCVRMRAIQSVMARPTCNNDVHATKVVNEVWDSCFADKRPFEEIYR